jgi:hypothetical protein
LLEERKEKAKREDTPRLITVVVQQFNEIINFIIGQGRLRQTNRTLENGTSQQLELLLNQSVNQIRRTLPLDL